MTTDTEVLAAMERAWLDCISKPQSGLEYIVVPRRTMKLLQPRGTRLVEITETAAAELHLHKFSKARDFWRRTIWVDKRRLRRAFRRRPLQ